MENENNQLHIYNSIEQMEEAAHRKAAEKDPVSGLQETVELILRVYGVTREDLNQRKGNNRIRILYYK